MGKYKTLLTVEENCYKVGESEISNFIIKPLYLLKHPDHPKRIIQIENKFGDSEVLCIPIKALVSLQEFKTTVEGRGNFLFFGKSEHLTGIKEIIFSEEKVAEEISVLGYQKETGFYAFCNGIFDGEKFIEVDKFGIVETAKGFYFIPALSEIYKDGNQAFANEKKFRYQPSNINFKEWASKIVEVYGDKGKIGICYLISAAFRDLIFDRINCFPLLYLFGPPECGKSSYRDSFQFMFGEVQSPLALGIGNTSKAFNRKLAQFCNALIGLEEYKNDISKGYIEALKAMYDSFGYERASFSNDNKTISTPIRSTAMVTGQQMPTKESALFSRSIMLTFYKKKWDDDRPFEELKFMEENGLGKALLEILKCRKDIEESYKPNYNEVKMIVKKSISDLPVSDRQIKNITSIVTPVLTLRSKLEFPFDLNAIIEIISDVIRHQYRIMQGANEINTFWRIFESLIDSNEVTEHYHYKTSIKEGKRIYIDIASIHHKYMKYGKTVNLETLDLQTLIEYLKTSSAFISNPKRGDQFNIRLSSLGKQKKVYAFDLDFLNNAGFALVGSNNDSMPMQSTD